MIREGPVRHRLARECRDEINRWCEEIRPDYLILRMRHPGGPPHARVVEAIRLFGEKVLPHV